VRIAIAGGADRVASLAHALAESGAEVLSLQAKPSDAPGSPRALAAPLVEFERQLDGVPELAAVVVADSSDAALAATLVAAKVPLPVIAAGPRADAESAGDSNASVIRQLALAAPGPDPTAILAAIAAAADRSQTTS
jgi:hypothetical protein